MKQSSIPDRYIGWLICNQIRYTSSFFIFIARLYLYSFLLKRKSGLSSLYHFFLLFLSFLLLGQPFSDALYLDLGMDNSSLLVFTGFSGLLYFLFLFQLVQGYWSFSPLPSVCLGTSFCHLRAPIHGQSVASTLPTLCKSQKVPGC